MADARRVEEYVGELVLTTLMSTVLGLVMRYMIVSAAKMLLRAHRRGGDDVVDDVVVWPDPWQLVE